jgi:hypothetical protein
MLNCTKEILLSGSSPVVDSLSRRDTALYRAGYLLLSDSVSDKFIDIPRMNQNLRFNIEGLSYELPYYDSCQLWSYSNSICLLVVYRTEMTVACHRSQYCPLSIDFKFNSVEDYGVIINDQRGDHTSRYELCWKHNKIFTTEIKDLNKVTLSQLASSSYKF